MSDIVFLRGAKTILRPVSKDDAKLFQKWINDPDVRKFILNTFPITFQEEENWIEKVSKDKNQIILVIETLEGVSIGIMGTHGINWADGTCTTGALIGEKNYWGQGYGTDAKMVLLHHLFNNLGLRKVCSSVKAFNRRSKAYLEKTGYQVEGVKKRQILYGGRYWDEILLAIFKKEFAPIWRAYKREHKL